MNRIIKKIIVLVPVILLGLFYLKAHASDYSHSSGKRIFMLALSFIIFYAWVLWEAIARKQRTLLQVFAQSSFFVYIFMVLTLTGFFILFREVSVHDWWHKVLVRIDRKDHVNMELFRMFSIYRISSTQIVGNFLMLLPLGFYIPLLYRRFSNFFMVAFLALVFSGLIEFMQLVTRFRSADVDDIFLNTLGACVGFLIFKVLFFISKSSLHSSNTSAVA